jgi:hypothetical protein
MDIAPPNQHPATSDDELAKVLAGIGANDSPTNPPVAPGRSNAEAAGLQFEETPGPMPGGPANGPTSGPVPAISPAPMATPDLTAPVAPMMPVAAPAMPAPAGSLDELKKTALEELRPLVGKLNLPPEEKFDTLLLIIRSTDDQSLLAPAHEAAQGIADENKRAQALLDVIKEIDYFNQGQQPPAIQ